jgi:predicted kinase
MLVLLTGLPGSGKTTLSVQLAREMRLPLIAKDRYKAILFDQLGVGDEAWSRQIGQAAIALQYDAMATVKSAVVDSALWSGISEPEVTALGLDLVQVHCDCAFELARTRFLARVHDGTRHPGHREELMAEDDYERFRPLIEPLRLRAPLVRVDTSRPVDVGEVIAAIATYA